MRIYCHNNNNNNNNGGNNFSLFRNGLPVYKEMKYLAEVKRFGMAVMFFSEKDKEGKNNIMQ